VFNKGDLKSTMAVNNNRTSKQVASKAGKVLASPNSSKIAKSVAASALSQASPKRQTGAQMETKASKALRSNNTSATTKTLAGSVVSQSNKKR
jgi:hypothetical protein